MGKVGVIFVGKIDRVQSAKTIIGAALCLFAAPAAAFEAGVPLWGDLVTGMTKAEVKSHQPETKINLTEECKALISFNYSDKTLESMELEAATSYSPECRDVMLKSMFAKYGDDPVKSVDVTYSNCPYGKLGKWCRALGGDSSVTHTYFRWVSGVTRIDLHLTDSNADWSIIYSAEPQTSEEIIEKF